MAPALPAARRTARNRAADAIEPRSPGGSEIWFPVCERTDALDEPSGSRTLDSGTMAEEAVAGPSSKIAGDPAPAEPAGKSKKKETSSASSSSSASRSRSGSPASRSASRSRSRSRSRKHRSKHSKKSERKADKKSKKKKKKKGASLCGWHVRRSCVVTMAAAQRPKLRATNVCPASVAGSCAHHTSARSVMGKVWRIETVRYLHEGGGVCGVAHRGGGWRARAFFRLVAAGQVKKLSREQLGQREEKELFKEFMEVSLCFCTLSLRCDWC